MLKLKNKKGRKHNKNMRKYARPGEAGTLIGDNGTLEEETTPRPKQVPLTVESGIQKQLYKIGQTDPLIGLDFVVEKRLDVSKEGDYVCKLCNLKANPASIIAHLVSQKHRLRYLKQYHSKMHSEITTAPEYRKMKCSELSRILKIRAAFIMERLGGLSSIPKIKVVGIDIEEPVETGPTVKDKTSEDKKSLSDKDYLCISNALAEKEMILKEKERILEQKEKMLKQKLFGNPKEQKLSGDSAKDKQSSSAPHPSELSEAAIKGFLMEEFKASLEDCNLILKMQASEQKDLYFLIVEKRKLLKTKQRLDSLISAKILTPEEGSMKAELERAVAKLQVDISEMLYKHQLRQRDKEIYDRRQFDVGPSRSYDKHNHADFHARRSPPPDYYKHDEFHRNHRPYDHRTGRFYASRDYYDTRGDIRAPTEHVHHERSDEMARERSHAHASAHDERYFRKEIYHSGYHDDRRESDADTRKRDDFYRRRDYSYGDNYEDSRSDDIGRYSSTRNHKHPEHYERRDNAYEAKSHDREKFCENFHDQLYRHEFYKDNYDRFNDKTEYESHYSGNHSKISDKPYEHYENKRYTDSSHVRQSYESDVHHAREAPHKRSLHDASHEKYDDETTASKKAKQPTNEGSTEFRSLCEGSLAPIAKAFTDNPLLQAALKAWAGNTETSNSASKVNFTASKSSDFTKTAPEIKETKSAENIRNEKQSPATSTSAPSGDSKSNVSQSSQKRSSWWGESANFVVDKFI